jgi:hypothetical protein
MKPIQDKDKTILKMLTTPNGRTVITMMVGGVDISGKMTGLSVHAHPTEPMTAEITLMIDEVSVDVEVAQNIVRAMIPEVASILDGAVADSGLPGYDGSSETETTPRTYG